VVALEYGISRLNKLPLSVRLIRELHEKLMEGVRGQHATPGLFRNTQNWIGRPGSTPATAAFIPPPPGEVEPCLTAWEKFLHESGLPPLVTMALAHYQFEAIHPFLDGNGRVGRLLITLFLIERKILPTPLLYLSAFFEALRRDYYEGLRRVRMRKVIMVSTAHQPLNRSGFNGIVPFTMECVGTDINLFHFFRRNLASRWVFTAIQPAGHA
jgi:Fic family protein